MPGVRLLRFFKIMTEARAWHRRAAFHDPAPISFSPGPRFGLSSAGRGARLGLRVSPVAAGAYSVHDAPEQANAPDRRHAGFQIPATARGGG
jgi:hypothetical protein